jgi:spermidine synthase
MKTLATLLLYKTVFLTGAAVLIIEVAAVRMLSPYYGASLYVFSSVLTIILSALAVGYYVGGRLADRLPRHEPLYLLIVWSGVLTLLAEVLAIYMLPGSDAVFSVMSGPLVFGFILFFFPALLLGIVSPYLVKLVSLSRTQDEFGRVAGGVFFFGTVGSITGSLLSGFLLIPFLGIRLSMIITGVLLVVLGVAGLFLYGWFSERLSPFVIVARYKMFLFLSVVLTILLISLIYREAPSSPYTVLYESDGVYGHIVVYEIKNAGLTVRALKRDTNNESAVFLELTDSVFEYTQFAEWYPDLVPDAKRFLMIGGGAYSVPRTVLARDPDIEVVVAEIEPDLYPLAERFFDLKPSPRLTNHIIDGRVFLNQNKEQFDVIFLDAFGTDLSLPAHLATREYFALMKKNLTPGGVLIVNYIGVLNGEAPSMTGSLTKTMSGVFPNMKMYAIHNDEPERKQNIVYVARNGDFPIAFTNRSVRLMSGGSRDITLMDTRIEEYSTLEELTFTDDRAPIEYLQFRQL